MALILIDRRAHRHAGDWFETSPSEPSGNGLALTTDEVVRFPHITMDRVLTEIVSHGRRGGDVMLVCHARELGLAIPLINGGAVRARSDAIGQLAHDRPTTVDGITAPGVSAADAAPVLMMREGQVTGLRQKMNQVRALGLRHVALRGCNVGAWSNSLGVYKEFFGCRSLSGPTLRDTYGVVPPRTVSNLTRWLAAHSRWQTFVEGTEGSQVAVATRGGQTEEHSYSIELAAQTAAALESWGTRHLGGAVSGRFFYHGMFRTYAESGSARILWIKDAAYAERLQVV